MPKPVCVPCQRFFRVEKNGFWLIEGAPTHARALPGTEELGSWKPYKIWMGDKWKCHGCGAEIVVGFGLEPVAEQHEEKFERMLAGIDFQVNDC